MSLRRKIDWTAAMRDMRNECAHPATGYLAQKAIATARLEAARSAAVARPLVVNGAFDRSAIMAAAIASARVQKAKGSTLPCSALVGSALCFTWARAKAARVSTTH